MARCPRYRFTWFRLTRIRHALPPYGDGQMVTHSFAHHTAAGNARIPAPIIGAGFRGDVVPDGPGGHVTGHSGRTRRRGSLDSDGGAGALEGFLRLVSGFLGRAFEDGLGGAVHEVLGFL